MVASSPVEIYTADHQNICLVSCCFTKLLGWTVTVCYLQMDVKAIIVIQLPW
jgi:hypothetical protein